MHLRRLRLGPMENFVYLLGDPDTREAAVVDPAWDVDAIAAAALEDGYTLKHAIVTHKHHDHVNGLAELVRRLDVKVHVNEHDADALRDLGIGANLERRRGGDRLEVGNLDVEFLHTPGHTPGSQCLLARGKLLSGDTLFIGSCGRMDLPGGSVEQMHRTLGKIGALPDTLTLLPGHDYGDVPEQDLGAQKAGNPYLRLARRDLAEFAAAVGG